MVVESVAPQDALGLLLRLDAAWVGVQRVFDQVLREEALSFSQAVALLAMAGAEQPLLMSQLAGHLVQEAQSITSLMDRLEKGGWARRMHDLPDRRAIRIELTEAGAAKVKEVRPLLAEAAARVASGLTPKQRGALDEGLVALYGACRSQPGVRLPERTTRV